MRNRPIVIIGAGVVGTAIAETLEARGFNLAAVSARSQASLERAEARLNTRVTPDSLDAAKSGDIIFITTPDDSIRQTCEDIAANGGFDSNDTVFHMSGALGLNVLGGAVHYGAKVGSIHPMQTFADIDTAITALPGSVFGVTAEGETLSLAEEIVSVLGGEPFVISDEDKPIYHAAACAVSNYLVGLVHFGEQLYGDIGVPKETADKAFMPLIRATVNNIEKKGTAAALTGPISRGDVDTIRKHLAAMDGTSPWAVSLYRELGVYTIKVALEKGTISRDKAAELEKVLEDGK
jgi:predicted short-subunit dehydrogenase-like oxidoreductase (DUF2520 family)